MKRRTFLQSLSAVLGVGVAGQAVAKVTDNIEPAGDQALAADEPAKRVKTWDVKYPKHFQEEISAAAKRVAEKAKADTEAVQMPSKKGPHRFSHYINAIIDHFQELGGDGFYAVMVATPHSSIREAWAFFSYVDWPSRIKGFRSSRAVHNHILVECETKTLEIRFIDVNRPEQFCGLEMTGAVIHALRVPDRALETVVSRIGRFPRGMVKHPLLVDRYGEDLGYFSLYTMGNTPFQFERPAPGGYMYSNELEVRLKDRFKT